MRGREGKERDYKERRKDKNCKEKERECDRGKEREAPRRMIQTTESDAVDASDVKDERKRDKDKGIMESNIKVGLMT